MFKTLISARELCALGDKVKIFDCRTALGDPDHGRRLFAAGHIQGAQYLSLDDELAAPPGRGGRHPLPEAATLAARLAALGVNEHDQVVVYDDAGGAFAARAWWCIRWLGHAGVAVLDGGLAAWTETLVSAVDPVQTGDFRIRPSLTRTVDAPALAGNLPAYHLIDARSQARYDGAEEPIDPVAGHIPGAICLPFQGNLTSEGTFASPDVLRNRFCEPDRPVVCYCGSGVTAAHNILAMIIAGYDEPGLYPGSWSEWILAEERPRSPATNPFSGG